MSFLPHWPTSLAAYLIKWSRSYTAGLSCFVPYFWCHVLLTSECSCYCTSTHPQPVPNPSRVIFLIVDLNLCLTSNFSATDKVALLLLYSYCWCGLFLLLFMDTAWCPTSLPVCWLVLLLRESLPTDTSSCYTCHYISLPAHQALLPLNSQHFTALPSLSPVLLMLTSLLCFLPYTCSWH